MKRGIASAAISCCASRRIQPWRVIPLFALLAEPCMALALDDHSIFRVVKVFFRSHVQHPMHGGRDLRGHAATDTRQGEAGLFGLFRFRPDRWKHSISRDPCLLAGKNHQQRSRDHQQQAQQRSSAQFLLENNKRKRDGHNNAHLVDGDDDADDTLLQGVVVA